MLSDLQIKTGVEKKTIVINPFFEKFLGPNLYYCHLGSHFLFPKVGISFNPLIDRSENFFDKIVTDKPIELKSGQFILAETFESFGIDNDHIIRLYNSSSLARCGIYQAALGMINPGCGIDLPIKLTLELCNLFPETIILTPTILHGDHVNWGTEVLKVAVEKMDTTPSQSYDTWQYAAYGKDTRVATSKMNNRFGQETNK